MFALATVAGARVSGTLETTGQVAWLSLVSMVACLVSGVVFSAKARR
jgi:hypothetical protein